MGVFTDLISTRSTLAQPDAFLSRWFNGGLGDIYTGREVNHKTALTYSAWAAGVLLISEVMGSLPAHVYRRGAQGDRETREIIRDHPLEEILTVQANPELSAMDWRGMIESHLLSDGNHYSQQVRDNGGRLRELWPLEPTRMEVHRNDQTGKIGYLYRLLDGSRRAMKAEDVFHVKMFSRDGVKGIAPLELGRQAIGVGLAVEEFAGRFFSNGSTVRGTLQTDGQLKEEAFQRLKKDWQATYQGQGNSHKVAILEHGLKFQPISANPKDSQMLDLRKFQVTEVARLIRVPPHLLQDLDRATFNNIEELGIGFVKYSLLHRCVRIEQEIARQLLAPNERSQGVYVKHNLKGLLRGDTKTQSEFYKTAFEVGGLSPDDFREYEDLNPLPNGEGGMYTMQVARAPLSVIAAAQPQGAPPPPEPKGDPEEPKEPESKSLRSSPELRRAGEDQRINLRTAYEPMIRDRAQKLVNVEVEMIRQRGIKELAKRSDGAFLIWLDGHREAIAAEAASRMGDVLQSYARALGGALEMEFGQPIGEQRVQEAADALTMAFAADYANGSAGQLSGVLRQAAEDGVDPVEAVETRVGEWKEKRAEKVGRRESTGFGGAFASTIFIAMGVTAMRWRTVGKNCPLCNSMSGRIVRTGQPFLASGETLTVAGAAPLSPRRGVKHPPLHGGCNCIVSPG